MVTPPANLVLLVSLTEDNHQFGNDIRSVWTTLLRQRLVLTECLALKYLEVKNLHICEMFFTLTCSNYKICEALYVFQFICAN